MAYEFKDVFLAHWKNTMKVKFSLSTPWKHVQGVEV